ncbi:hypothetical protein OF83DRAFT_1179710 [Amylostereum chailletii]|nr:hypothetical protein OF83DRAFT_1179710 [Amylostereum chailletii]
MPTESSSFGVTLLSASEKLTRDGKGWNSWKDTILIITDVRGVQGNVLGMTLPPLPLPPPLPASPGGTPAPIPPITQPSTSSPWVPSALSAFLPIYTPTPSNASLSGASPPILEYTVTLEEYERRERVARAHIMLNVADLSSFGLTSTQTAAAMWYQLRSMFEVQNPLVVRDAKIKMSLTMYSEGTPVADHWATQRELLRIATNAGALVTDKEFTSIVMGTFAPDGPLGQVVMSLYGCSNSLTAEAVLTAHEQRIAEYHQRTNPVPSTGLPSTTALSAEQRPKCENCGKTGHTKDRC